MLDLQPANLVKLRFLRDGEPSGKEYSYISKSEVAVGDTVVVRLPEDGDKEAPKGIITQIDVPVEEVESFKDKLKEIVGKVGTVKKEVPEELPAGTKLEPDFVGDKMIGVSLVKESE